jgi:GNAT superfamily N-acetyltransferase
VAAPPAYVIQPLGPQHDRKGFQCGEPSLDEYLQRQVGQDVKRDLAACYVLTEPESAAILGYYPLSASSAELHDLPPDLAKKSARYPLVPAVLLGRLAVARSAHGRGLGAVLLADALGRALRTGIGVKLVVVDALSEAAAAFYEHHGFQRFHDTALRLFLPVSTIAGPPPDAAITPAGTHDQ